ncbi:MAG: twin-arginine translocase subunit TatC, partial [Flavobacteriales bacterium]|nr:twin-arginine translocase subunit TatC [Flavobacteriales bacterium]
MTAALIGGLVLAFPYIFWQVWQFISPGLRSNERKAVSGIVFYVSLLFFFGVAFGYFMLSPLSTLFLGGYDFGVENKPDLRTYTKLLTGLTLATGFMFQLPVVIYFLTKAGLVNARVLRKFRRHALVIVLIVSAIITPPDVTSQILVSVPVLLLYELGILVAKRVEKRRVAVMRGQ